MTTEIRVPTLGESVTEATVATWFKKPGDPVAADEMLCELETDKVTVEVPAPAAGTLDEIVAKEGETVGVDALLAEGAVRQPKLQRYVYRGRDGGLLTGDALLFIGIVSLLDPLIIIVNWSDPFVHPAINFF